MTDTSSSAGHLSNGTPPPTDVPTVEVEGVAFSALTMPQVVDHVMTSLDRGEGGVIITPNVDIMRSVAKKGMGHIVKGADLVVADGMPLVWASRLQGASLPERVTGSGLVWALSEAAAAQGHPVFFCGAAPGVAAEAGEELARLYPGLKVAGSASPPLGFDKDEAQVVAITEEIRRSGARLVFLAFGWPKQELLAQRLRDEIPNVWFLGCGGALDMAAGRVDRAHPMLQKVGAEWVHRLAREPRRLAQRYLVDDAPFAVGMLGRSARRRRSTPRPTTASKRTMKIAAAASGDARSQAHVPHHDDDAVDVAYLVSQYPALSHAFIEREVEALREAGARIETISVRPFDADDLRTETMRSEAATTTVILDKKGAEQFVRAHAALLRRSPTAYAKVLGKALRTGESRPRARLWQVFYFGEAVVLHHVMNARDLHHVHAHFANNGADIARLTALIGKSFDGPDSPWAWTFTMHGPTEFEAVEQFDLPAKVKSADGVACISDFCRSQLMRMVDPRHWDKLAMIRMSVDTEKFAPPADSRENREGPMRVLYVGRLVPEKGSPVLLDALTHLKARGVQLDVQIVGKGELHEGLAQQIERDGLSDSVRLVGAVGQDDLPALYHWADVFVLPSFQEGLPVVLMEAMSTGLPVVTTQIAAVSELVDDPEMGRVLPPGRSDLLADALEELAADPVGRREAGRRGRAAVEREFTSERSAAGLLEFFRSTHDG